MKISPCRPALAILAPILLVACSGEAAVWTFSPPTPSPVVTAGPPSPSVAPPTVAPTSTPEPSSAPSGEPTARPSGEARVIELEETAALQIHRDGAQISSLTVKLGETIHFRISNLAGFTHNFYIGPADKLSTDEVAGLPGVPNFTQGTAEFDYTVTVETATLQFACTVPGGHYQLMHGTFTVEP